MRLSFPAAIFVTLAALPGSAPAAVYKCVGEGSQPIYQDSPCPPGRELRNFDTDPPEVSVIPFRIPETPPSPVAAKPSKAPPATRIDKKKDANTGADIAQRKFIVAGMNEGEVVARIGQPDMTTGGKGRKSSRWSYLPAAGDPHTVTTVVFDYGKVVDVERKIVK